MCMVSAGAFQAGQRGNQRATPSAYLSITIDTTPAGEPYGGGMTLRSCAVGPVLTRLG